MGKKIQLPQEKMRDPMDENRLGRESVLNGEVMVSRKGIRVHLGSTLNRALVGDKKSIRAISKANRCTVQEIFKPKPKKVPEKK